MFLSEAKVNAILLPRNKKSPSEANENIWGVLFPQQLAALEQVPMAIKGWHAYFSACIPVWWQSSCHARGRIHQ